MIAISMMKVFQLPIRDNDGKQIQPTDETVLELAF